METVQPERVKLALRLGQSRALYEGFQVLATARHTLGVLTMAVLSGANSMRAQPKGMQCRNSACMQSCMASLLSVRASKQALKDKSWGELSQAQRRIVDEQLRDFKHGGVALEVLHHAPHAWHAEGRHAHLAPSGWRQTLAAAIGETWVSHDALLCCRARRRSASTPSPRSCRSCRQSSATTCSTVSFSKLHSRVSTWLAPLSTRLSDGKTSTDGSYMLDAVLCRHQGIQEDGHGQGGGGWPAKVRPRARGAAGRSRAEEGPICCQSLGGDLGRTM